MNRSVRLIHCSYDKCLTVYFRRVMHTLFNRLWPGSGGYHHFRSDLASFYRRLDEYRVVSVNNHVPDLDRLGEFRMTRFVRDPRDLVVSGYFYHRKGSEAWTRIPDPTERDFAIVNGCVPEGLRPGESYAAYLNRVSKEQGLIVEIQFRKNHFASMQAWSRHDADPRIRLFRYETVLSDGPAVFRTILAHYGLGPVPRKLASWLARLFAVGAKFHRHVRDPRPGQWRDHFTPAVVDYLEHTFPGLTAPEKAVSGLENGS